MFRFFGRKSHELKNDEKTDDALPMASTKNLWRDSGVHTGRLSDFTEQGAHKIDGKYLAEAVKLARVQTAAELVNRLRSQNTRWLNALLEEDHVTLGDIVATKRLEESSRQLGKFTLESRESENVTELLEQKIDVTGQAIEIRHLADARDQHRSA